MMVRRILFVKSTSTKLVLYSGEEDPFHLSSSLSLPSLLSDILENPTEDSDLKKRSLELMALLMKHSNGCKLLQVICLYINSEILSKRISAKQAGAESS